MSRRKRLKDGKYKNKSRVFLLPMLGIDLIHVNEKIDYLIDVNFVQDELPKIVLIFDNIDYEPLTEDVYRLKNNVDYLGIIKDDDDKELCMFFDIPSDFKDDFELFTKGKYSQLSTAYKNILIRRYNVNRGIGVNRKTNLPNVNLYDAIKPLDKTKEEIATQLGVEVEMINEVLDPPNLKHEEFKHIEDLVKLWN